MDFPSTRKQKQAGLRGRSQLLDVEVSLPTRIGLSVPFVTSQIADLQRRKWKSEITDNSQLGWRLLTLLLEMLKSDLDVMTDLHDVAAP